MQSGNGTVDLDEAATRRKLIEQINGALAEVEAAEKRVADTRARNEKLLNDCKAQLGTAEAEAEKAKDRYRDLIQRLGKRLPNTVVAYVETEGGTGG